MRLNGRTAPTFGYAAACGQSRFKTPTLVYAVVVATRSFGEELAVVVALSVLVDTLIGSDDTVLEPSVVEAIKICASASMRVL